MPMLISDAFLNTYSDMADYKGFLVCVDLANIKMAIQENILTVLKDTAPVKNRLDLHFKELGC